jgi:hypothetical protein
MAYHTFASTLSPTRFASTFYVVKQLYSVHLGAGVLDEPYSQLTPLSGVAGHRPLVCICVRCPSYVAWRSGMATQLSGLS